jgi:hypothetical protein
MQIAVLTFDGFNEIDSFVGAHILNRLRPKGWRAFITSPDEVATSMNGLVVHAERRLDFASEADAVIIGSGINTRQIADDPALLARPDASACGVAMFGRVVACQTRVARRPSCLHRPDDQTMGDRGRCVGHRPAVLRRG